jgi:hypothetical protein
MENNGVNLKANDPKLVGWQSRCDTGAKISINSSVFILIFGIHEVTCQSSMNPKYEKERS